MSSIFDSEVYARQRAEVGAAIERTRAGEEKIIARIPSFASGDELLRELNAA